MHTHPHHLTIMLQVLVLMYLNSFHFTRLCYWCNVDGLHVLPEWQIDIISFVSFTGYQNYWFWLELALCTVSIWCKIQMLSPHSSLCSDGSRITWLGWMGEITIPQPYSQGLPGLKHVCFCSSHFWVVLILILNSLNWWSAAGESWCFLWPRSIRASWSYHQWAKCCILLGSYVQKEYSNMHKFSQRRLHEKCI
jgi:hypothetical protein